MENAKDAAVSICGACGKTGANKRCSACSAVYYCDKECQKQGRKAHKPLCLPGKKSRDIAFGAPNPKKKDPSFKKMEELKRQTATRGIGTMQQELMKERATQFLSALNGLFSVRIVETGAEITSGAAISDMTCCTAEWETTEGVKKKTDFHLLSPASLAMEMHTMTCGDIDTHLYSWRGDFYVRFVSYIPH